MKRGKDDSKKAEEELAKIEDELDELVDAPDAPRLDLPRSQMAQVLGRQYVEYAQQYWNLRTTGEVCKIVGDDGGSKQAFEQAKKTVERISALKEVASDRGCRDIFEEMVNAYLDQEKEARAKERKERTLRAAKTGRADEEAAAAVG